MTFTAEEIQNYRDLYQRTLRDDIIPFWFPRAIDHEQGGFLHCFDRDGTLVDSDKSVWAQGRMAWMLFALYNDFEPRAEWLNWGENGLKFLAEHCFDTDGRMYFHVDRTGQPIRKRRYAFSESFAAIAYAAHFQATQQAGSAARALELFRQFTTWNFTSGMMPAKFTATRPTIGMGPRMITLVTAQEIREAVGETAELKAWIDRMLDEIERYFVKPELECVLESVSPTGEIIDHFDGRLLNPGHAIEGAWFIMREGEHRRDARLIKLGCRMLDWMWQRGWDEECGGLFYFRDLDHKPVQEYWHTMKFWWPHDEALIATLYAWRLTGEGRYAEWHRQLQAWSFAHFADPEFGEWYGYLDRSGRPSSTLKGSLWKSFFHHPRAMWWCGKLLGDLPENLNSANLLSI